MDIWKAAIIDTRQNVSTLSIIAERVGHTDGPPVAVIDISRRCKVLDLNDDDLRLIVDPEQFAKEVKEMDPQHFDPLPCNIMCVLTGFKTCMLELGLSDAIL